MSSIISLKLEAPSANSQLESGSQEGAQTQGANGQAAAEYHPIRIRRIRKTSQIGNSHSPRH
jgi:hypothetical protein